MDVAENKTNIEALTIIRRQDIQPVKLREKPKRNDAYLQFEAYKENDLVGWLENRLNKKREGGITIIPKGQVEKV